MTLGARQAGIEVVYAVEKCPIAASTYGLNFRKIPLFVGDIRKLNSVPERPKGRTDHRVRRPTMSRIFHVQPAHS